jgi:hypothetical protein
LEGAHALGSPRGPELQLEHPRSRRIDLREDEEVVRQAEVRNRRPEALRRDVAVRQGVSEARSKVEGVRVDVLVRGPRQRELGRIVERQLVRWGDGSGFGF